MGIHPPHDAARLNSKEPGDLFLAGLVQEGPIQIYQLLNGPNEPEPLDTWDPSIPAR